MKVSVRYVKIKTMNDKFFDLKKEKQDRMINAALKVFALQGYRHASTDDIVREAAISKGLLFHYFGSKLGVYTFIYEYSVRYMTLELDNIDSDEHDLFELMKETERARMRAMVGYPYMQLFLERSASEDVGEALLAVEDTKAELEEAYDAVFMRIDFSELPEGTDCMKLYRMIGYTASGLMTERIREGAFQQEMYCREICEYIDFLKKLTNQDME